MSAWDGSARSRDASVWSIEVRSESAESTRALAARLAAASRPGDVVLLVGGLGAGKTTFAQGFARGLGVVGPVTSPTFTLVRQYPCQVTGITTLFHADVYRLDSLAEVADLGLAELVEDEAVALVEWGDVAAPVLGDSALEVSIELGSSPTAAGAPSERSVAGDDVRMLRISGKGPGWLDRREAVASAFEPGASQSVEGDATDPGGAVGGAPRHPGRTGPRSSR